MKISRYGETLFFILLLGIAFNACKPKQKIVYSTSPVEDKANNQIFSDIITSEIPFHTFSAKLNMNFSTGSKSMSSKANIRIVRDDALQISIQPLFGVEMFRFYMNTDTVMLLDRMNKRYVMETIDSLKDTYPVGFDFFTLQSVLTNALFVSGKEQVEAADYRRFKYIRTSDQNYYLTANDAASGIDYSFTVNGDDRITFTHLMQPEKKHSLQWGYNNFTVLEDLVFPHKMNVSLSSSSRKVNAELLFSHVVTNEPIRLTMNVPNGYTRSSLEEILKFLSTKK